MSELYGHHPLIYSMNVVWMQAGIAALERPAVEAALQRLLDDADPWCFHPRGTARPRDTSGYISPRYAAATVLLSFPVRGLEPDLRRALAEEKHAGRSQVADRIQLALDSIDLLAYEPTTPLTKQIDELVADASPGGFERLVDFVWAGSGWRDSPQDEHELRAIHDHVGGALEWLDVMVVMPEVRPPKKEWGHTSEAELREAISSGALGTKLMEASPWFEPLERATIVELIADARPAGYREWLERVVRDDPDWEVRDTARRELSRAR
jgi:hypothetical protein